MKKTGLKGFVYNFSVNYETTDVSDIVNNQRYSVKTHCINIL